MADTGAPYFIPYVEPTDLVRDYPAADEASADAIAAALDAAGGLVAVKSAIFTGVQTNSTASGANFAITGLTIAHEVADAANKVVLYATVNGSSQFQTSTTTFGAAITAGGVLLGLGDADGTRVRVASTTAGSLNSAPSRGLDSLSLVAVSTPGVTTSVTYGVNVINVTDSTQAINVNKSSGDANDALHGRAACFLLLMEVKV